MRAVFVAMLVISVCLPAKAQNTTTISPSSFGSAGKVNGALGSANSYSNDTSQWKVNIFFGSYGSGSSSLGYGYYDLSAIPSTATIVQAKLLGDITDGYSTGASVGFGYLNSDPSILAVDDGTMYNTLVALPNTDTFIDTAVTSVGTTAELALNNDMIAAIQAQLSIGSGIAIIGKFDAGYRYAFSDARLVINYSTDGSVSQYNAISVAGSFNNYSTESNVLDYQGDGIWQGEFNIGDVAAGLDFKFVADMDWLVANWGENEMATSTNPYTGTAELESGVQVPNIAIPEITGGDVIFTFNENTYEYTVEKLTGVRSVNLVGDFNGWNLQADAMVEVSEGVWELEKEIEATADVGFKFVYNESYTDGDWGESDQSSTVLDISGVAEQASGNIVIGGPFHAVLKFSFVEATQEYSVTVIEDLAVNYNSIVVAGNFNGWSLTADVMNLQTDGSYQGIVDVVVPDGEGTQIVFKFVADGDWSVANWGSNGTVYLGTPISDTATLNAFDIRAENVANGTYKFTLNPQSRAFSVERVETTGDTDLDGMPDIWEDAFGLDKNDSSDATLNLDGDCMSNLNEYIANTDPTIASDYLHLSIADDNSGNVVLTWNTKSGVAYTLYSSADLITWNVEENIASPGDGSDLVRTMIFSDARKFFRIGVQRVQ